MLRDDALQRLNSARGVSRESGHIGEHEQAVKVSRLHLRRDAARPKPVERLGVGSLLGEIAPFWLRMCRLASIRARFVGGRRGDCGNGWLGRGSFWFDD